MRIIAADDEARALRLLTSTIMEVVPDAEVLGFQDALSAIEFASNNICDAAFLDIHMRDMTGLELAKRLKDVYPDINVVFVTGYSEYALEAFGLYASGYILKPVDADGVRRAMANLRHPIEEVPPKKNLYIRCFGSFEVFHNGTPLNFSRAKSKELLAYLTDRAGATCTTRELISVLWEDEPAGLSQSSNLRNLISDLKNTLATVGQENILIKGRGTLSIDIEKIDCDYIDFLRSIPSAVNSYRGEYMVQYSWAEMTAASLK